MFFVYKIFTFPSTVINRTLECLESCLLFFLEFICLLLQICFSYSCCVRGRERERLRNLQFLRLELSTRLYLRRRSWLRYNFFLSSALYLLLSLPLYLYFIPQLTLRWMYRDAGAARDTSYFTVALGFSVKWNAGDVVQVRGDREKKLSAEGT